MKIDVVIPDSLAGARVDRALAELCEIPVNAARRLLETGRVRLDGRRPKKGDAVRAGARLDLEGEGAWLVTTGAPMVDVLFEGPHVVVLDKPAGMPCHPLVPGEGGTLADAVAARFPEVSGASVDAREGGLLHRLDTGTSGCIAVARDRATWEAVRAAFERDEVSRRYLALVEGVIDGPGRLTGGIAHDPRDARRMIVDASGRAAVTVVEPVARGAGVTLVACTLEGGRRHQIRVHLADAGNAIVGDVLYGAAAAVDAPWPLLHAARLRMPGMPEVHAPPPVRFVAACTARGLALPGSGI